MAKLKKSESDRLYVDGKSGEWAEIVVKLCIESGIDIPIIKKWFAKGPTIGKYLTFPLVIMKMAEEVLDNNRSFFKTIGDVIRTFMYVGAVVVYRLIIKNKDTSWSRPWGEANYKALVRMQEAITDIQVFQDNVKEIQTYYDLVKDKLMEREKFECLCKELIKSVPEIKRDALITAYNSILNNEKVPFLRVVGGHGGYRDGAGRKKVASDLG